MQCVSDHAVNSSNVDLVIKEMTYDRASLLKTLGAGRLRSEMAPVGWLCRFIVWLIFFGERKENIRRLKNKTLKMLDFFFPTKLRKNHYMQSAEIDETAVVVYFNHQSLFEVLATIAWCLRNFEEKRFLFPVNLPWYECLAPLRDKVYELGLVIVPLITPKTYARIKKLSGSNMPKTEAMKYHFERYYFEMVGHHVMANNIIAVAPSATRTATVFPSREAYYHDEDRGLDCPKTISAVLLAIRRTAKSYDQEPMIDFVPLAVSRRGFKTRGLNVFLRHDLFIGRALTYPQVLRLKHKINFVAHRKLTEFLPEKVKYPAAPT